MTKPTDNELFDINQPFVTQEQKFKYWEESKAEIKCLQAQAELANKEKAELQALVRKYEKRNVELQKLALCRAGLQAQINDLREALAEIHLDTTDTNSFKTADIALAKTAPQCLQEHDNENKNG